VSWTSALSVSRLPFSASRFAFSASRLACSAAFSASRFAFSASRLACSAAFSASRLAFSASREACSAANEAAAPSASREIALGCGFAQPRWEWRDGPAGDTDKVVRTLPTVALQQLSALTNGYLLLRSEQPATVAADTRIRRWLGVGMSDSIGEAKALTIAIGEDSLAGRAQVGLCLEFGRAEDALAAVKRIETQSAGGVIQFAVNPQAENVARQHRLVVVRFEVGAAYLMLAAKPR